MPAPRWPAVGHCGAAVGSGQSPAVPLLAGGVPAFVPTAASPPSQDWAQLPLWRPAGETCDCHLGSPVDRWETESG